METLLWVFLWPALCGASYGLNYATACACLYDTSMLASMMYLQATIRALSLLVTNSRIILNSSSAILLKMLLAGLCTPDINSVTFVLACALLLLARCIAVHTFILPVVPVTVITIEDSTSNRL
jgi:hypothetical protein